MQHKLKWAPTTAHAVTVPKPHKVVRMPLGDRSYDDYEYERRQLNAEYMTEREMKGTPR